MPINYDAIINGETVEEQEFDVPQADAGTVGEVSRDLIAVARHEVKVRGDALAKTLNEADALVIADNDGLLTATELQGQIKKALKEIQTAGELLYKPRYNEYKAILNVINAAKSEPEKRVKSLQSKMDSFATLQEMERRKKERAALDAAAALQKKLDAEQAAINERARAAAKKEKKKFVAPERVIVDAPIIPRTIEARTEHGSAKLDSELIAEITDYNSDYIIQCMFDYCWPAFKTLALTAIKKAIKAGALGIAGADGVTVTEKTTVKHRRK